MIGEGGMATVYRARHTLVDRPVAVKIMAPHLRGSEQLAERFRREAKNAAALTHPNIIEIHDHGETARGRPLHGDGAAARATAGRPGGGGPHEPGRRLRLRAADRHRVWRAPTTSMCCTAT
jgi:hypothetical protein